VSGPHEPERQPAAERESLFRQVLHEAPQLSLVERLGSLGVAVLASVLLTVLVFVLWWLWLTWMPIADGTEGPIPLLLEVEDAAS
jgi:hypothetical protein